ncbi:hypothetical protein GCM10027456_42380 [Kineosporia babensis]
MNTSGRQVAIGQQHPDASEEFALRQIQQVSPSALRGPDQPPQSCKSIAGDITSPSVATAGQWVSTLPTQAFLPPFRPVHRRTPCSYPPSEVAGHVLDGLAGRSHQEHQQARAIRQPPFFHRWGDVDTFMNSLAQPVTIGGSTNRRTVVGHADYESATGRSVGQTGDFVGQLSGNRLAPLLPGQEHTTTPAPARLLLEVESFDLETVGRCPSAEDRESSLDCLDKSASILDDFLI